MDRPVKTAFMLKTNIYLLGLLTAGVLGLLTGCEDLNVAVDGLLGKQAPVLASSQSSRDLLIPVQKRRAPGEAVPPGKTAGGDKKAPEKPAPAASPVKDAPQQPTVAEGKRRKPGTGISPETLAEIRKKRRRTVFGVERDPFRPPTEVLPSECPPSVPLCRFDRSQLKLVGILQVDGGGYKGMVEDPDGRGYFVSPGMQIGGATVTQVSNKGVTLHVHETRQDVMIPLTKEPKEGAEF